MVSRSNEKGTRSFVISTAVTAVFTVMIFMLYGCSDATSEGKKYGITERNYPVIDGSTSAIPIMQEIYKAMHNPDEGTEDQWSGLPETSSKTMESYEKLIRGEVDLIIVPDPSEDVKKLAEESGVELEYTPICCEALIFIVNDTNKVDSITTEQIKSIYTDKSINDWSQLADIKESSIFAYSRNEDSGSYALFDKFILKGEAVNEEITNTNFIENMFGIVDAVNFTILFGFAGGGKPIAYTLYYFFHNNKDIQGWDSIKILDIEGISPTPETISSGEYPYSTNYYAVIKKDTSKRDASRKIISWLLSENGKEAIQNAGFGG